MKTSKKPTLRNFHKIACTLQSYHQSQGKTKNNSRVKETKETWQLNATWDSEVNLLAKKNITDTIDEMWMRSQNYMVEMYQH